MIKKETTMISKFASLPPSPALLGRIQQSKNNVNKNFANKTQLFAYEKFKNLNSLRHKAYEREISKTDKIKAFLGSSLATLLAMGLIAKKQKVKNPFAIEYSIKEMFALSSSAILGGVGFGMINEDKKTRTSRIKEGVFQFFNSMVPVLFTNFAIKFCEKNKNLNNAKAKIFLIPLSVFAGVLTASKLSNKICDPKNKEPDRKITLKDSIANIDDLFATLALIKIPFLSNLKTERILPLIYALCGYRAGESN